METPSSKRFNYFFKIGVIIKGIQAALECILGISLLFVSTTSIRITAEWLGRTELTEDPNDIIANYLIHSAQHLSIGSKTFIAYYLITHAIVKMFLVLELMRNRRWAYPTAISILGILVTYDLFRFAFKHSIPLLIFSFFDCILIYLIWYHWKSTEFKKQNIKEHSITTQQ